jgi:hypothetical protein
LKTFFPSFPTENTFIRVFGYFVHTIQHFFHDLNFSFFSLLSPFWLIWNIFSGSGSVFCQHSDSGYTINWQQGSPDYIAVLANWFFLLLLLRRNWRDCNVKDNSCNGLESWQGQSMYITYIGTLNQFYASAVPMRKIILSNSQMGFSTIKIFIFDSGTHQPKTKQYFSNSVTYQPTYIDLIIFNSVIYQPCTAYVFPENAGLVPGLCTCMYGNVNYELLTYESKILFPY